MNVLHISYSLSAQSAASIIARQQIESGINVFFLLGRVSNEGFIRDRQVIRTYCLLAIACHIVNIAYKVLFKIHHKEIFSFKFIKSVQKIVLNYIIKKYHIDIVHLHWGGFGFFSTDSLSKTTKTFITAHDYQFFTGGCHIPMDCEEFNNNCRSCPMTASKTGKLIIRKTRIENIKNISTKGIVVITPSTYAYKKISNFLTAKLVIYPNFISSPFPQCFIETQFLLNEYEEKLLKNETKFIPRIISVGTYNSPRDNKGAVLLRSVINNLIDLNINFEIVTIGEYISFKGMCKHMHINRVSPDELMKLYATSDLCLVTSKYETFSQVTMESILCGTPVIAFDVTGPKDIIKKCNLGFLVKGFNADMYQKKVQSEILFKKNNLKFIESNATKVINYNNINKEQYMNLYL